MWRFKGLRFKFRGLRFRFKGLRFKFNGLRFKFSGFKLIPLEAEAVSELGSGDGGESFAPVGSLSNGPGSIPRNDEGVVLQAPQ